MKPRIFTFAARQSLSAVLLGAGFSLQLSPVWAQNASTPASFSLLPVETAQRLLDNEKFAEAAALLTPLATANSTDYRLLWLLGQAHWGNFQTAEDVQKPQFLELARVALDSARRNAGADIGASTAISALQTEVQRAAESLQNPAGMPRPLLPLPAAPKTRGANTAAQSQAAMRSNLPLRLPSPPIPLVTRDAAILAKEAKNRKYPTHAAYDELGKAYVELGLFDDASRNFRTNAEMFRRKGNHQAAVIHDQYAARYESDVRLFVDRPLSAAERKAFDTRAPLEPPVGTYLGAFIDRDERLKDAWQSEYFQTHRKPEEFAKLVGKPHATYFMYARYGNQFPRMWLEQCKAAKVIPHLAWEPHAGLEEVKEDEYLINFAKECGKLKWPIFLRYASEMNGAWTPWHGNPALYREKFQLVHRVFKQYAPNVATIWCVNSVPVETIEDYYPGDESCDWVGINLYSVPFYSEKAAERPGDMDSPTSLIEPIYQMFANRKPIALCEYASSQMHVAEKTPRTDFAINKMSLLYSSLPRLFPRIKMVSWFDVNNLIHAPETRRINNYSLTENGLVLKAYQSQVSSGYFLPGGADLNTEASANLTRAVPRPISPGQNVRDTTRFSIWVKTPVARPLVFLEIGNKIVYAGKQPGTHIVDIDTASVPAGRQPVTVYVYNDAGRFIAKEATSLTFGRTRGADNAPFLVTGRIKSFYSDRSGLVSALRVQGAGNESWLHFPPSQAQNLLDTYPLNGNFAGWVRSDPTRGEGHFVLLSAGEDRPTSFVTPSMTSDDQRLTSEAPVQGDVQTLEGKLSGVVTDTQGQVLAIEIDGQNLVRVSSALTNVPATAETPALTRDSAIRLQVQPEALAQGEVSAFSNRWVASEIEVGGRRASGAGLPVLTLKQVREISGEVTRGATKSGGMKPYLGPLPTDSATARTRGGGLAPLISGSVRPW